MGYPDFPIPEQESSYIPAEDMLTFLGLYAKNFGVMEKIKFLHHVLRIRPKTDGQWEVRPVNYINTKHILINNLNSIGDSS